MINRETRPDLFHAFIGFSVLMIVYTWILYHVDFDMIEIVVQGAEPSWLGSLGGILIVSYSMKFINNSHAVKYRLIDGPSNENLETQRFDAIISLIFLYNMPVWVIKRVIPALLEQLEISGKDSPINISCSSGATASKEFRLIERLVAKHNARNPRYKKEIVVLSQPEGKGKKLGAMVPHMMEIREYVFNICKILYGDRFNEEQARAIDNPKAMELFLRKNDFRILLWVVDGDTVLPGVEEVNFFQELANVMFNKQKKCAAITADNLAITEGEIYLFKLYTKWVRYLGRYLNLTSTEEPSVITGRVAIYNALLLFDKSFVNKLKNGGAFTYGRWYYKLTGDDKDLREYIHELGMKAIFVYHLYVYSIEEQPKNGTWRDYTLPGYWLVGNRTGKNGMRMAQKFWKTKTKLPVLLRIRYFWQANLYFSPIIGPLIAYFTGALIEDDWGLNNTLLFWLLGSTIVKVVELLIKVILRKKRDKPTGEEILIDILSLPQAALMTRLADAFTALQRCFTVDTLDVMTWDRSSVRSCNISSREIAFRRVISVTRLSLIVFCVFLYTSVGVK